MTMLNQRGQLLRAALGFAGLARPSCDRALWALRAWLDSWAGIGHVAVGIGPAGLRSPAHALRRARLAGDVLHDGDGAFTDERDGHRMEQVTWRAAQGAAWRALTKASLDG